MRRRVLGMLFLVTAMLAGTESARADAPPEKADDDPSRWLKELDVTAGSLEADLKLRELELRDGVRVRLSPYYLRSERIHLSLTPWGVRVVGDGVLTFCPCDDPPFAIGFSGGYAGPPDELIVEDPTLRVFGLPVFWLPYLWLRSPRKIGLTMPTVSFRGADGLFLGQGLHLPVGAGLELGVGAYTRGGFATTMDFATERTVTLVRFDFRSAPAVGERDDVPSGVGLSIDAHGELGQGLDAKSPTLAWDVDAIRGARGLRTTLELEPLARPYDRASAETRVGPLSLGVDVLDRRGESLGSYAFAHPFAGLAFGGALGTIGAFTLTSSAGPRLVHLRRADWISDVGLGVELGAPLGLFLVNAGTQLDARGAHSGGGPSTPEAGDGRGGAVVAEGKLEVSLPLARRLSLVHAAGGPPVLHIVEPLLRFSGVGVRGGGDREALAGFLGTPLLLSTPSARDATGSLGGAPLDATSALAGLAAVGARSSIGAMSGGIAPGTDPWIGKLTAELSLGVLALPARRDAALAGDLRFDTRTSSGSGVHTVFSGALARSILPSASGDDRSLGWLALGRFRWDTSRDGLRLELRSALRGELPVLGAWALLGADAAPRLATVTGLATPGTTAGVGAGFPIGLGMRLGGDVDAYADRLRGLFEKGESRLLDVHGTFRYRHPCGCFRFGLRGGHVVGREGVDVFANLELAQVGVNDPRDW